MCPYCGFDCFDNEDVTCVTPEAEPGRRRWVNRCAECGEFSLYCDEESLQIALADPSDRRSDALG